MSYTPHTWVDNETITAAKLNNLEEGVQEAAQSGGGKVAAVSIKYSGWEGSVGFYVAYARDVNGTLSIESPMQEYYSYSPYGSNFYIPVPLTSESDEFKPYILWKWDFDQYNSYTIIGDISTTKVTALLRNDESTWYSGDYLGFEVMGDGEIAVSYFD